MRICPAKASSTSLGEIQRKEASASRLRGERDQKMSTLMILLLFGISVLSTQANKYASTTKVLDELFSHPHYDKRLRPYMRDRPVNVTIRMTIVHFGQIRERDMDFEVDLFLMQHWHDERLKHSLDFPISLDGQYSDLVWLPDTIVLNIKKAIAHNVPNDNSDLSIYPDGTVHNSLRVTLVASCGMDLRNYPMDEQTCNITLLSYAYKSTDLDYFWSEKFAVYIINKEMNEFHLKTISTSKEKYEYASGAWIHITASFVFNRNIGYSLLQVYAPTTLIVALSWLAFWIPRDAVPARITLSVTTILTIVTLMGSFRTQFPKVSYVKAVDVFLIVSFLFVFSSALELVLVLIHSNMKKDRKHSVPASAEDTMEVDVLVVQDKQGQAFGQDVSFSSADPEPSVARKRARSGTFKKAKRVIKHAVKDKSSDVIDRWSRWLFPLLYIGFIFVYWIYY
ncbi:gamma-aminobutyric acid receptor subunit beta-1 isoform X2 [Nematostella vectensis]|uniref:gamma-aminobutyric acid receptor subunit beta-1 isoform X2 n=1 Tax=Nematostella vectensis TaxID=45351 RepID=UPI0020772854|nr:gamma-aminobutyric acid receptor subunit beta-1 isoform X2 [Nematostella vectensis]